LVQKLEKGKPVRVATEELKGDCKMSDNKLAKIETNTQIIIVLLTIICLALFGRVLKDSSAILLPFVFAIFLTFLLNPIIDYFDKLRIPRVLSIILTSIMVLLLIVVIGSIVKDSFDSFALEFPKYEKRIDSLTDDVLELLHIKREDIPGNSLTGLSPQIAAVLDNFSITNLLGNLVSSISNLLSNAVLVLIVLLFLLVGRHTLLKKIKVAFHDTTSAKIASIITNINEQIQKYLVAKTVISLITAILTMIVLYLFDLEFVAIWGLLTFLLNFIPSIGSIIATVLPLIFALVQFDSIAAVAWLGLCLFAVQFTVGNIVEPKIMGKQVNLSPVMIMFALIFWGWQWGIIGMLLAVPLTVLIKIILDNIPKLRFISILMSATPEESVSK
jgi:predicted PurR-regulated permease PerM